LVSSFLYGCFAVWAEWQYHLGLLAVPFELIGGAVWAYWRCRLALFMLPFGLIGGIVLAKRPKGYAESGKRFSASGL